MIGNATNGVAFSKSIDESCLGEQSFIIHPNASMSSKCAWVVFLGIVVLSLAVMMRFILLGAWMVVPFTILEVTFIGGIFWLVIRSNQCIETVIYNENELKIIQENSKSSKEWVFQSHWAKVFLQSRRHVWYPDRLLIKSHGRSLEIGKCLTEPEKTSLAKALNKLLSNKNLK